jgi:hypothetical protein
MSSQKALYVNVMTLSFIEVIPSGLNSRDVDPKLRDQSWVTGVEHSLPNARQSCQAPFHRSKLESQQKLRKFNQSNQRGYFTPQGMAPSIAKLLSGGRNITTAERAQRQDAMCSR